MLYFIIYDYPLKKVQFIFLTRKATCFSKRKAHHKLLNLKIQRYISEDNPLKTARMFNYKESYMKATKSSPKSDFTTIFM